MIYPQATWAPWQYGGGAYYRGQNKPAAVVLHIMAGYIGTALNWAATGYQYASWHFSVARDGRVYQHLDFPDGGYHAGWDPWIRDGAGNPVRPRPEPTWSLWRGRGQNVNHYTIGIEHEGFPGVPFTPAQAEASKRLCAWLAQTLGIPLDRAHFPAHAEIDSVDRSRCFNLVELREQHYQFLLEDDMTPEESARLQRIEDGMARLEAASARKETAMYGNYELGADGPTKWGNMFEVLWSLQRGQRRVLTVVTALATIAGAALGIERVVT